MTEIDVNEKGGHDLNIYLLRCLRHSYAVKGSLIIKTLIMIILMKEHTAEMKQVKF